MDLNLASAIGSIKVAMKQAADTASIRHLNMYGQDIKCKPACAGCCNRLIFLTAAEAVVMVDYLIKHNKWEETRKRCESLVPTVRDVPVVSWFKMNIMCPVLDPVSRLCTAYETRPSPCSTHFVKSDPGLCDPWNTSPGTFEPLDFMDLHNQFTESLAKAVDGYGILALRLPMPMALLFADRIRIRSGLNANEIISLIHNELV